MTKTKRQQELSKLATEIGRVPTKNELRILNRAHLIDHLRDSEEKRIEAERSLRDRLKELGCLYGLTTLFKPTAPLEMILRGALGVIANGFQYPTQVRITYRDVIFQNEGFVETPQVLSVSKQFDGGTLRIDVFYSDEEWTFLREERYLLEDALKRLGDVCDRRHKEQQIKESEQQFKTIAEQNFMGILIFQDDRIKYLNNAAVQIFRSSREEVMKRSTKDLLGLIESKVQRKWSERESRQRFSGKRMDSYTDTWAVTSKSGSTRFITFNIRTITYENDYAIMATFQDVTERKKAEQALQDSEERYRHLSEHLEQEVKRKTENLIQSAKLASIGQLTAGIAHEINNPLTGIINYAQILLDELAEHYKQIDLTVKPFSFLHGIVKEGNRIGQIVTDLLTFSRKDREKPTETNIFDVIGTALALLAPKVRLNQITVLYKPTNTLPSIPLQQNMLQVLLNVLHNAIDALTHVDPPNRLITIDVVCEKNILTITIRDNGQGIQKEILPNVFDPFYTTKPTGTGLGLSVSYGIVKDHRGDLVIHSEVGKGTTVEIALPTT